MFLYLKDVVSLRIDAEKCTGCGFCLNVCPRGVLALKNRKAVAVVKDACLECGACAKNCPAGAVTVQTGVGCATALLQGSGACCCSAQDGKGCCEK